jgi:methyltransferase (TIGR00027 family)
MQSTGPSLTARGAATHRAVHQLIEGGRLFSDPYAVPILGVDERELLRDVEDDPGRRVMRLFIAARTRFTEDALAAAVASRGVRQLVVLGAGLDTFAYRNPWPGLAVFEVDHPATQQWKRERLAQAGIAVPESLSFVPVDFEHEGPAEGLAAAGFDERSPAFFSWLGVVPYLTRDAISATLRSIGELPGGGEVVFDYGEPPELLEPEQRAAHLERAAKVARIGEPWQTYFTTGEVADTLAEAGLSVVDDLGPTGIRARYFGGPKDAPERAGGHLVHAAAVGPRS